MTIGKPCKSPRCPNLVLGAARYCEAHRDLEPKPYSFKRRPPLKELYNTTRWQKTRAAFLAENPVCARCGRPANTVHHVAMARENPELWFDFDNLEALCRGCHAKESQREGQESKRRLKDDGFV